VPLNGGVLAESIATMEHVLSDPSDGTRRFYFFDPKRPLVRVGGAGDDHHHQGRVPMAGGRSTMDSAPQDAPYVQHSRVPAHSFFERVAQGHAVYYSSALAEASPALVADATPLDPLGAGHRAVLGARGPLVGNLWLASEGVVAHAHYDSAENVFVQVAGTKSFIFYPPSAWIDLAIYPRLHPYTRQGSVDPDDPRCVSRGALGAEDGALGSGSSRHAAYCNRGARYATEAVLHPGDVALLPAFWFHHVRAESSLSVSVSSYVDAAERDAFRGVAKVRVPVDGAWPRAVLVGAVCEFFARVVAQVQT
jgi:hypothetical protein